MIGIEADSSGIASSESGRFRRSTDECRWGWGRFPSPAPKKYWQNKIFL